ncbi:MAG TPA: class I SAM-dependent methyltransferase [Candidatus Eremiobacteraceae bacterium]|nr:class I SAM-dependent methyltransferase [Candidatus Eremiobacteraceae bacterium]
MYDLAFGFRQIPSECRGLLNVSAHHGVKAPASILDIACGPAHHLREYARLGLSGFGVDLNREMLAYARHLSKRERLPVHLKRADMRAFEVEQKVDIAQCLFDSFSHCTTDDDAVAALRCVARALRKGGVFVLELTHPADFFTTTSKRTVGRWSQRYPDVTVKTRFLTTNIDPIAETYVKSMTIDASYKDGRPAKHIVDRQLHRMWLRSGISHVAAASGAFDIVGWYGDLSPRVPLDLRMSSWRMVTVLRRRN